MHEFCRRRQLILKVQQEYNEYMKRHCRIVTERADGPNIFPPFTVQIGAHTHDTRTDGRGRGRRVDECGIFPERKQTQITITEREGNNRCGS